MQPLPARTRNLAIRILGFTVLALVAFAANSVLCRLALAGGAIDAASFSTARLVSGAAMLLALSAALKKEGRPEAPRSWVSALALFLYAVPFSFAYLTLGAGTGALILFGSVQATMILAGLRSGERPRPREWLGWLLALAGMVYLLMPGLKAPSPAGSALMASAGVAWGVYSLRGRGAADPLVNTTVNFARTVPLAILTSLVLLGSARLSWHGVLLAVTSGAVTSGLGYVVWYAALRGLTATRAALVQLAVPALAALGGVVFLSESPSLRLILSALLILGGIATAITGRRIPKT